MSVILHQRGTTGGRALRGYFGPPMRPKNENCLSQVLLISLLEQ